MDRWVGKVAIVTGASAGIGAAIAESLVREGLLVVGLARREQNILKLAKKLQGAKGRLYAKQVDIVKEEELMGAFEWVKRELGGVDVLVNNAGLCAFRGITDGLTEEFRKMLELNVLAVALCTREAVLSMKQRGVDGHIFNINSVCGHSIETVTFGLYSGTKFAVTAMTEVVRKELIKAGSKIKITSISPGLVETEIFEASGFPAEVRNTIKEKNPILHPKDVADALVYALGTPTHVQVTELTIRPVGEKA